MLNNITFNQKMKFVHTIEPEEEKREKMLIKVRS